jgi:hypothetical protein
MSLSFIDAPRRPARLKGWVLFVLGVLGVLGIVGTAMATVATSNNQRSYDAAPLCQQSGDTSNDPTLGPANCRGWLVGQVDSLGREKSGAWIRVRWSANGMPHSAKVDFAGSAAALRHVYSGGQVALFVWKGDVTRVADMSSYLKVLITRPTPGPTQVPSTPTENDPGRGFGDALTGLLCLVLFGPLLVWLGGQRLWGWGGARPMPPRVAAVLGTVLPTTVIAFLVQVSSTSPRLWWDYALAAMIWLPLCALIVLVIVLARRRRPYLDTMRRADALTVRRPPR